MYDLKRAKPTTSGRRGLVYLAGAGLHKGDSYKPLTVKKNKISGRNNYGRITVRHRGGGHKRNYRVIDWFRMKDNILGRVERIEYDPNRSSFIMLVVYSDGERRYNIAPNAITIGSFVQSGVDVPIAVGNCLPLENIPTGTFVYCIEINPGCGAVFARSAGCCAQLLSFDNKYAILKLRSGEIRRVPSLCRASVGIVCNSKHVLKKLGKAGRARWLNRRPTVRGVAMNPVDHPHGGGEGKTSGGRHPCTPWGKCDSKRTRKKKFSGTTNLIMKRRK